MGNYSLKSDPGDEERLAKGVAADRTTHLGIETQTNVQADLKITPRYQTNI
jgi:hypothetical protein